MESSVIKQPKIKTLYLSRLPSCNYVFSSGKIAHFIGGEYFTDDHMEKIELDRLVADSHPHIYQDDKRKEVDVNALSPLEEIKRKAIEEYQASLIDVANVESLKEIDVPSPVIAKLGGVADSGSSSSAAATSNSK